MDNSNLGKIFLQHSHHLQGKKIVLGFDGFVDTVSRVIRQKTHLDTTYFESIGEFGKYASEKSGKNFSLELEESTTKLGGNMPIMANALARLGTSVSCVGALGYPSIHPVFKSLAEKTNVHSFADPGISTALEFKDGKILLAQMTSLNKVGWSSIKDLLGIKLLRELFSNRDLVCVLNWSELDHSTSMWTGLLEDILPGGPVPPKKPIGFFDLSDCSRRSEASVSEAVELLKSFANYWQVVLSVNLNEATILQKILAGTSLQEKDIERVGEKLLQLTGIDTLLIHYSKRALAWNQDGIHIKENPVIQNPLISTGAGDNFNAGYCAGLLMGIDISSSLALGHAVAGHYMRTGTSPQLKDLI